jgi:hypothetical protein
MRITIADTTADAYQAFATKQGRPLDQIVETQLARFRTLEPGTPAIVIGGESLERLTIALGGLSIRDGADLATKVDDLAAVSFQHIRLNFSPQHLAELQHRAERQGKSVESLVIDTVNKMAEDFFWRSGGGESVLVPAPVPSAAEATT